MSRLRVAALSQLFAGTAFALMLAPAAQAEQTVVPLMSQSPQDQSIPRPKWGETQAKVLKQFGEPKSKKGPVGKAPYSYTQWHYDKFTVFFEGDRVIHTVLNHQPQNAK